MDVLVTGGAGFIGSQLCGRLRSSERADRIVVLDDLSTGHVANLDSVEDAELVVGSISNEELVAALARDVDVIVHLAAVPAVARSLQNPRASHDTNVTGTIAVLEAARRHDRHVIVASSSSVYGRGAALPTSEDAPTRPASPYAASKLAAESYGLAYARSFGLRVLAFRFFNVYGPHQRADHAYAAVIPAFVAAARRGEPLEIHGDGTQTRDFTYVGDVTAVLAEALAEGVINDGPVNLAFGSRRSLNELVAAIEEVLGHPVERAHVAPRPGDVHDSQADSSALHSLFPSLRATPLREGLRATMEWFASLDCQTSVPSVAAPLVPR